MPEISPVPPSNANLFGRWKSEIDHAQKDKKYTKWLEESEKIVRRYRDERSETQNQDLGLRRLNILWSNIQTLRPALYAKDPIPVVERRFMDRDPVARTASMILERTLMFQNEISYYGESVRKAVLDYLLPGMGQVWLRYEPVIERNYYEEENDEIEEEEGSAEDVEEEGDGTPYEKLSFETLCVDYVFYKDFLWSQARCWEEVRWVARRSYLTRSEIAERFYDGNLSEANQISLDCTYENGQQISEDKGDEDFLKKAQVWEIWNKSDRKVYFFAPGSPNVGMIEVRDDPLGLENFWPCPEPIFTTQTNETLIPVPDYIEYQDQAEEIDDLTNRINQVTKAVKAAGVYDASVPSLQRLLQQGMDNQLIPVDQWAVFAEKGGMRGALELLPMKEIIDVLLRLYEARAQVKIDLQEVTGISDIVRGQGTSGSKTATEQRIKGQFATLRLQDRQAAVARFARDIIRIQAEMISEHFSEESLMEMSGYMQIVHDDIMKAKAGVPKPQPPQPGQPPQVDQMGMSIDPMVQYQQALMQAEEQATQKALDEFAKAVALLRSDKLRGFRVDIETDSTIQVDAEADKQSAVELITATFQGLANAAPIVQQSPELIQPIGKSLMFVFRRFRVGRTIEAAWDEALDKIEERMKGPQPPNPEEIKAQAEVQKQQLETARSKQDFDQETALNQQKMMMAQQNMELKQREMALKEQEMALKEREMMMEAALTEQQIRAKSMETMARPMNG